MPVSGTITKENIIMQLIGYARVSTSEQSLDRQVDELRDVDRGAAVRLVLTESEARLVCEAPDPVGPSPSAPV